MPVILTSYNTDNLYDKITSIREVTVVNEVSIHTKDDRDNILQSLYTKYTENSIDGVPTCECGDKHGTYLIGTLCTLCNTTVVSPFSKLESTLWLKTLPHVTTFMNPIFYRKIDRTMGTIRTHAKQGRRTNTIPFMLWLTDPTYKTHNFPVEIEIALIGKPVTISNNNLHLLTDNVINSTKTPIEDTNSYIGKTVYVNGLEGFKREYNYVINNIDKILRKLSITSKYRSKKDALISLSLEYLANKEDILSKYLPIVSNKMFVMEKTATANYVDMKLGDLTNVILNYIKATQKTYINIESSINNNLLTTARILHKLAENADEYINAYIAHKEGIARKHIYGSRNQFIFRYVITPIHGPSVYNEIHVPWSVGLVTYKLHLFNKMVKDKEVRTLGWTGRKILDILDTHINTYHPIIDRLLKEMVTDTREGEGICIGGLRNPGLLPGSIQRQFITRFKTDPLDQTVSISILCTSASNADFDGDQLAFLAALDNQVTDELYSLDLCHSVPEYGKPYTISGFLNLPAPAVEILNKWIDSYKDTDGVDNLLELVKEYN